MLWGFPLAIEKVNKLKCIDAASGFMISLSHVSLMQQFRTRKGNLPEGSEATIQSETLSQEYQEVESPCCLSRCHSSNHHTKTRQNEAGPGLQAQLTGARPMEREAESVLF